MTAQIVVASIALASGLALVAHEIRKYRKFKTASQRLLAMRAVEDVKKEHHVSFFDQMGEVSDRMWNR